MNPDWEEIEKAADRLGLITRKLVDRRDLSGLRQWCVRMAGDWEMYGLPPSSWFPTDGNDRRIAAYRKLAAMAGPQ